MWGCLSSQGGTWSLGVTAASPWAAALAQHEAEELRHRSRQRARGRISLVVPRFPPPAGVGSRPSGHVTRSSSYLALACVPVVCLVIKTLIWPSQRKSNFFSLRTGAVGTEARVRRTSSSRLLAYPSRGVCSQAVRGSHRSCCLVMDTIMEQFNPSLRNFIAMGKNYEKALAGVTYAAKGYFDALVKMGELASESQGSKELGKAPAQQRAPRSWGCHCPQADLGPPSCVSSFFGVQFSPSRKERLPQMSCPQGRGGCGVHGC
uniref:BAR/IMD domain containing adaptor protein 2 n=1 Tax=Sus scrofa TaxID=9823 RepID=A0A8D0UVE8_PIG